MAKLTKEEIISEVGVPFNTTKAELAVLAEAAWICANHGIRLGCWRDTKFGSSFMPFIPDNHTVFDGAGSVVKETRVWEASTP
jgi:hypothetical protein